MRIFFFLSWMIMGVDVIAGKNDPFYPANDSRLIYMGRMEKSDKRHPKMWASAAQVSFSFKGKNCSVVISDEQLFGTSHNYIDVIVDRKYARLKLKQARDTIVIATGLADQQHDVVISKSTEAGIGYIVFEGVFCPILIKGKALPTRKIESYGDSITSAMGSDTVAVGCHKAAWYDQTNGYKSYAAITARRLQAQYHLTSVSGIGMIHSCCNMDILMPQVYDKISPRDNRLLWDFKQYQPDVVTICLGQNDGVQDSLAFCSAYVSFIKKIRGHYPRATIVCLTSPMADAALKQTMIKYLSAIVDSRRAAGDKNLYKFYFSRQSIAGCDYHPSLSEHEQIAGELTAFIRKIKKW